jgi:hypothetical protein
MRVMLAVHPRSEHAPAKRRVPLMTSPQPQVLTFPDRKRHGRLPVVDASGETVAWISTSWTGASFSVQDKYGNFLCKASAGLFGLSSTWQATGSDGNPLLRLTRRFLGSKGDVHLERGGDFLVRGSAWRRDFVVTDERARPVLLAVPRTHALSLRPHDYAVEQTSGVFLLGEMISLVQIWRMARKSDSTTAAVTSATSSGGMSS